MGPEVIVIAAVVAAPLSLAWEELHRKAADTRARRARCQHTWGTPQEVAPSPWGRGPRLFVQWCPRCGDQRPSNQDGTPYVPASKRQP